MIKNPVLKLLFILLTFISISAPAQTQNDDQEAVKKPINNLFTGMKNGDTALIRSSFAPTGILQTIVKTKEGTIVKTEPVDSFLAQVAKQRISYDVIKIDADLASAWTPYKFYVGEKFSHCGVNSFQLVKIKGDWKIQYIIDTRRRQGCE
jgi:hypothetical protein